MKVLWSVYGLLVAREQVAPAANQIMEEALKVISAYQQARFFGETTVHHPSN